MSIGTLSRTLLCPSVPALMPRHWWKL